MLKKLIAVQMVCLSVSMFQACGQEDIVEVPVAEKINMTIHVENNKLVDISGLSIQSGERVDPDEQVLNPENNGIKSLLGDDELKHGDVAEISLTIDDPNFHALENENGELVGVQKFKIIATDRNGGVRTYDDIELKDGAWYVITQTGLDCYDSKSDRDKEIGADSVTSEEETQEQATEQATDQATDG